MACMQVGVSAEVESLRPWGTYCWRATIIFTCPGPTLYAMNNGTAQFKSEFVWAVVEAIPVLRN